MVYENKQEEFEDGPPVSDTHISFSVPNSVTKINPSGPDRLSTLDRLRRCLNVFFHDKAILIHKTCAQPPPKYDRNLDPDLDSECICHEQGIGIEPVSRTAVSKCIHCRQHPCISTMPHASQWERCLYLANVKSTSQYECSISRSAVMKASWNSGHRD